MFLSTQSLVLVSDMHSKPPITIGACYSRVIFMSQRLSYLPGLRQVETVLLCRREQNVGSLANLMIMSSYTIPVKSLDTPKLLTKA